MNPRITKEFRVLRPAFVLTLSAAVLPWLIGPNRHEVAEIWMELWFFLGCLIMGAESFGNEFEQKTLSLLLTQPIPRTSIWKDKMQVLGGALAVGTGVFGVTMMFFRQEAFSTGHDLIFHPISYALIALGVLCTTPYWTLLFRSTLIGGLLTVVAPGPVLGVNSYLHYQWIQSGYSSFNWWFVGNGYLHQQWIHDPTAEENSVVTLLILYSAACCWLGYDRFRKLQVVDAHSMAASRELGLPPRIEALLLRPCKTLSAGFTGPLASLMKKELRLQQFAFLFTVLCCAIAIAGLILRQWHFAVRAGHDWAMALFLGGLLFTLPVLPLIAGAVSVAEEKAWGVVDWHLTLPPSALKQWSVKVLVALGTSLVLGLVLPVAAAVAGTALLETNSLPLPLLRDLRLALNLLLGGDGFSLAPMSVALAFLFCVVLGQMLLTSVAIYAGSIATTTARALVLALGLLFATGCLVKLGSRIAFDHPDLTLQFTCVLQELIHSQLTAVTLMAAALFLPLCLVQYVAYRGYRTGGMTFRLLGMRLPRTVLVACFLAIAFLAVGGIIRILNEGGAMDDRRPVAGQRAPRW